MHMLKKDNCVYSSVSKLELKKNCKFSFLNLPTFSFYLLNMQMNDVQQNL